MSGADSGSAAPGDTTVDGFLDGRLAVEQPRTGAHRAGLDAVLLAAAVPEAMTGRVVDLGAGVGVAGLCVAARCPGVSLDLVEIDPSAAALARSNAVRNAAVVGSRIAVTEADVTAWATAGLARNGAAAVIMNPPYHPADRTRPSPSTARSGAHRIEAEALDGWMRAAAGLLHPQGRLVVIFRADETPRLLALAGKRFGGLALLPIHPRAGGAASRVLLAGRPQSRAPFRLLPGLVLHEADGRYTSAADAILRGARLAVDPG